MAEYEVTYNITGYSTAIVIAETIEDARAKAEALDIKPDSDQLQEWNYGDVVDVSKN